MGSGTKKVKASLYKELRNGSALGQTQYQPQSWAGAISAAGVREDGIAPAHGSPTLCAIYFKMGALVVQALNPAWNPSVHSSGAADKHI